MQTFLYGIVASVSAPSRRRKLVFLRREQGRSDAGLSRLNMTNNCVKKSYLRQGIDAPLAFLGSIYLVFFRYGDEWTDQADQQRRWSRKGDVGKLRANKLHSGERRDSFQFHPPLGLLKSLNWSQTGFLDRVYWDASQRLAGLVMPKTRLLIKDSRKNWHFALPFLKFEIPIQADPTRILLHLQPQNQKPPWSLVIPDELSYEVWHSWGRSPVRKGILAYLYMKIWELGHRGRVSIEIVILWPGLPLEFKASH